MLNILITVTALLFSPPVSSTPCPCGYGGLCRLNGSTNEPLDFDCKQCGHLSDGLYENCFKLKNHCKSHPCRNGGTCQTTFGSFFCYCLPRFIGHRCEYKRRARENSTRAVIGPRVWYQVNRITVEATQVLNFVCDNPGDQFKLEVSLGDGRFLEFGLQQGRFIDARTECLNIAKLRPNERDENVCSTIFEGNNSKMFNINLSRFTAEFVIRIPTQFLIDSEHIVRRDPKRFVIVTDKMGSSVVEGRIDKITVRVMNARRLTFRQKYRLHTSFDLGNKCFVDVLIKGCSKSPKAPAIYDSSEKISLRAVYMPRNKCNHGAPISRGWSTQGASIPMLQDTDTDVVTLQGQFYPPEVVHHVDHWVVIQGALDHQGSKTVSYNYGRCYFSVKLGEFEVGLLNGETGNSPCTRPLILSLFAYNSNFWKMHLTSFWSCNCSESEDCARKIIYGADAFLRTLPCMATLKFSVMVIHVLSGSKVFLSFVIERSAGVDELHCRCVENCYPKVDPAYRMVLIADDFKVSTRREMQSTIWEAKADNHSFGIAKYIKANTRGAVVEIPGGTFRMTGIVPKEGVALFSVRAKKGDRHCSMWLLISLPEKSNITIHLKPTKFPHWSPIYTVTLKYHQMRGFYDYSMFEVRQEMPYGVFEPMDFIVAARTTIHYVRPTFKTYIVVIDEIGLADFPMQLDFELEPAKCCLSKKEVTHQLKRLKHLALIKNARELLSESVYLSRDLDMSEPNLERCFRDRGILLQMLREMNDILTEKRKQRTGCGFQLEQLLTVLNRLTLSTKLTKDPYNVEIRPWKGIPGEIEPRCITLWNAFRVQAGELLNSVILRFSSCSEIIRTPNEPRLIELMFDALVRLGVLNTLAPSYHALLLENMPYVRLTFIAHDRAVEDLVERNINLLLAEIDLTKARSSHDVEYSLGDSTMFGSVEPYYGVKRWNRLILNKLQKIRVKISFHDNALKRNDMIFLGVFVDIPRGQQFRMATSAVNVVLLTHKHHRTVNASIEVHLKVQKTSLNAERQVQNENVENTAILSVNERRVNSSQQRPINVYKVLSEVDGTIGKNTKRGVILALKSPTAMRVMFSSSPPTYDEFAKNSMRVAGHSELLKVVKGSAVQFMGVSPDVRAIPTHVKIDATELICVKMSPPKDECGRIRLTRSGCKIDFPKNATSFATLDTVSCTCRGPGKYFASNLSLKLLRVMNDFGDFSIRIDVPSQNGYAVFIWILIAFFLIIFLKACSWDRQSYSQLLVFRLANTLYSDSFSYIIGVTSSKEPFSGTGSRIGLRIIGTEGTSRACILRSERCTRLERGGTHWFVIFTNQDLGTPIQIHLWSDFSGCKSDWYCKTILLYDPGRRRWYEFPVNNRFSVFSPDEDNILFFVEGEEFEAEKISSVNAFWTHYMREFASTHIPLCIFFRHERYLLSNRAVTVLSAVKIFSIYLFAVVVSEIALKLDPNFRAFTPSSSHVFSVIAGAILTCLLAFVVHYPVYHLFVGSVGRRTKKTRTFEGGRKVLAEEPLRRRAASTMRRRSQMHSYTAHSSGSKIYSTRSLSRLSLSKDSRDPAFIPKKKNHNKHKWVRNLFPVCQYRPLQLEMTPFNQHYRTMNLIFAWLCALLIISGALTYIIYKTITNDFNEYWDHLAVIAVLLEILIIQPLAILFRSFINIYVGKMTNIEILASKLDSLEQIKNIAQISDLQEFLAESKQPYYNPPTVQRLKKLRRRKLLFFTKIKHFVVVGVSVCGIAAALITLWLMNFRSMIQYNSFTTEAVSFPKPNNFTSKMIAMDEVRSIREVKRYLLSSFLPTVSTTKWYNGKDIHEGTYHPIVTRIMIHSRNTKSSKTNTLPAGKYIKKDPTDRSTEQKPRYFYDRSSKPLGSPSIRFLLAANGSSPISPEFRPYFKFAHGHFDPDIYVRKYSAGWTLAYNTTTSTMPIIVDKLGGNIGIADLYYPEKVGVEYFMHSDADEEAQKLSELLTESKYRCGTHDHVRAIIVEYSVLMHGSNNFYGWSAVGIRIVIENAATGIFSASARSFVYFPHRPPQLMAAVYSVMIALATSTGFLAFFFHLRGMSSHEPNYVMMKFAAGFQFIGVILFVICQTLKSWLFNFIYDKDGIFRSDVHITRGFNVLWVGALCSAFMCVVGLTFMAMTSLKRILLGWYYDGPLQFRKWSIMSVGLFLFFFVQIMVQGLTNSERHVISSNDNILALLIEGVQINHVLNPRVVANLLTNSAAKIFCAGILLASLIPPGTLNNKNHDGEKQKVWIEGRYEFPIRRIIYPKDPERRTVASSLVDVLAKEESNMKTRLTNRFSVWH